MNVGDKVFCKGRGSAVIIEVDKNGETAAVIFLKTGMYNPEIVYKKDLEVISED
tara:strand:+ start:725 stop:886 length:162 start_codon:yes stop_codon:yes gene_type:complete